METVNIPFRMIANKLPTNGSLTNILTIKNQRFHQMNVLGNFSVLFSICQYMHKNG